MVFGGQVIAAQRMSAFRFLVFFLTAANLASRHSRSTLLWLVSLCVFSDRRKPCIRQNLQFDVLATVAKTKSRRNGAGLDPILYGFASRNGTRCIVHSGDTLMDGR